MSQAGLFLKRLALIGVIPMFFLFIFCQEDGEEKTEESVQEESQIGIGPVRSVEVGALDAKMAGEGEGLFKSKCSACHKIGERYVGPDLKGVTTRRKPEWIMNMILNPTEMTQKDPTARALLAEYAAPMAQQNLKEEEARKVLEYFRSLDAGK